MTNDADDDVPAKIEAAKPKDDAATRFVVKVLTFDLTDSVKRVA